GVYVFSTTPGIAARTLTRPQPARFDSFGYAMAVAGSNVVIGSPGSVEPEGDVGDAGAAFLMDPVTGDVLQTFTAPVPAPGDTFGAALEVDGDRLLVGAPDAPTSSSAGVVYEFDLSSGALLATYSSNPSGREPIRGAGFGFGATVTRAGARVVVGAAFEGEGPFGEVRLFDGPGSTPALTLASPLYASFGAVVLGVPG